MVFSDTQTTFAPWGQIKRLADLTWRTECFPEWQSVPGDEGGEPWLHKKAIRLMTISI